MIRNRVRLATLIGLVLILAAWGVRALAGDDEKSPAGDNLAERLDQVCKFGGYDDPKTTLADVIVHLGDNHGLPITVNERAFAVDEVKDVLKTEIASPTPIPEMTAPRKVIVRRVLDRIPASSGATYLIRAHSIELTTLAEVRKELGREPDERLLPLVYAAFDKRPLEEVLKTLADRAEYSVVLDNRIKDKEKTAITARFRNVPLDTAVRLVADMAGLEPVLLDNSVYVTTPENAARLEKEHQKRSRFPAAPPPKGTRP